MPLAEESNKTTCKKNTQNIILTSPRLTPYYQLYIKQRFLLVDIKNLRYSMIFS